MSTKRNKILFIGSYLSKTRGTKGTAEKIAQIFKDESDIEILLTSNKENLVLRFFDIIKSIICLKPNVAFIDIYSGLSIYFSLVYSVLLKLLGIPFNIILRGGGLPELLGLRRFIFEKVIAYANEIYTPSKYLQKIYEKKERRILIFPNFIDESKFYSNLQNGNLQGKRRLLWVRAFTEIYNPTLPIEAINILKKDYPNIHLTMVGPDLGMMSECKLLIYKYELEQNITLTGKVSNEDLIDLYHNANIFLNTPSIESYGMALFEAAFTGLPIISTKVGDIPNNFIHEESILFVENFSPLDFANSIKRLFENNELRMKILNGAITVSKFHTLDNVKNQILGFLRKFDKKSNGILFVGSFFSKTRGTLGVSENLSFYFSKIGVKNRIVSKYKNLLIRVLDIGFTVISSKFDIIHVDVFSGKSFQISLFTIKLIKTFRPKKRIIVTLHGGALIDYTIKNENLVKLVLSNVNVILTPSINLKLFFEQIGFNVIYQPNPIDQSKFIYLPHKIELGLEKGILKLLWVRAFSEIYNAEMAIKCAFHLKSEYGLNVSLTMVGPDLGTLSKCKSLVKEMNLGHQVTFVGAVSNSLLGVNYYNSNDIYLNTTNYESFGVSLMEAASCGIPIVTTNVGEIPLLWSDDELILVNKGNHIEMADAILFCLKNEDFVQNMVTKAYQKSKNFDHNLIINQWLTNVGLHSN